jgi:hypothetical protein
MAEPPHFAEGHEHTEDCALLYVEWKRYHAVVLDMSGRFTRQDILAARREREKFERQLQLVGCSGERMRRIERDREIAEHGRPLLG